MTRVLGTAFALIACALLGGCWQDATFGRGVVTGTPTAERVAISGVRVFEAGQPPSEPFEEIAILQVETTNDVDTRTQLVVTLQRYARDMGGNGLVDVRFGGGGWAATGVAVRFADANAAATPATTTP